MAWKKPRSRHEEQRVRDIDRCACCGRPVAIGAEKLSFVVLGTKDLIHMACHDDFIAGKRASQKSDMF